MFSRKPDEATGYRRLHIFLFGSIARIAKYSLLVRCSEGGVYINMQG